MFSYVLSIRCIFVPVNLLGVNIKFLVEVLSHPPRYTGVEEDSVSILVI
jgi:hypothetical protein